MQMHKQFLGFFLAFCALVLLAGCASAPPKNLNAAPVKTTYKIGPGDSLHIFVRNNPQLTMNVPVRPDGKISIPLVKSIQAAGKTPRQLADDLQAHLSQYIRNPLVTVIVTNFVGTYADQIRVVGQAAQPQSIPYSKGMTLLDAMIKAGGLTQYAAGNRATLARTVNGKEKKYSIHIQDLLNGDINNNVPLRPGDVIIIPRTYF
jgi:polysaccharide export outer membrane protein